jgi:hypothetical protein
MQTGVLYPVLSVIDFLFSLAQVAGSINCNYCLRNLQHNEVPTIVLIHVILTAKLTALVSS